MNYNQLNHQQPAMLVYREWIGNAKQVSIVGDFNNWNTEQYTSKQQQYGVHYIEIPFIKDNNNDYIPPIPLYSQYKIYILTHQDQKLYKQPLHCLYAQPNPQTGILQPRFFYCDEMQTQTRLDFSQYKNLRIYECHIGISSPEPHISTYKYFTEKMIPLIAQKHYNCIQILGIQEHSFYASFGYQVTSFFAPSSRYGTPNEFRELVEAAHKHNIIVLIDLIHSHASKNETDGISRYDGTDFLFHQEDHPLWDSKVFDYSKMETIRFLLQNIRFWIQEFNIDGFRFDGVMSMLYWHRSKCSGYTGNYKEYYGPDSKVDVAAMTYLRLAHVLINEMMLIQKRTIITIAEDVSGIPQLATKLQQCGIGFDYRFQMAAPQLWIDLMKKGYDMSDDQLNLSHITYTLTNRRFQEKYISYCECHDQSLVGDKTLLMWLLNEQIYTEMSIFKSPNDKVKRGIGIHKLIRFITSFTSGNGYLNFIGNEFGHPEWLDFPRQGNNWSYKFCRRQMNLENETVRYKDLGLFDRELMEQLSTTELIKCQEYITRHDDFIVVFERDDKIGIMNWGWKDVNNLVIPLTKLGNYQIVLDSDYNRFCGTKDESVEQLEKERIFQSKMYQELTDEQQKELRQQKYGFLLENINSYSCILLKQIK